MVNPATSSTTVPGNGVGRRRRTSRNKRAKRSPARQARLRHFLVRRRQLSFRLVSPWCTRVVEDVCCLEPDEATVAARQRESLRAAVHRGAPTDVAELDAFVPPFPILAAAERTLQTCAAASQKREYRAYRAHRASRRDLGGRAYRTDGTGDATVTNDVIRGVACGQ